LTSETRTEIETNFIIALASWSALNLMERHSSKDFFDAFAETVSGKPHPPASKVHIKTMAYKSVADAIHPILWTSSEQDLNLLEVIHNNWSSGLLQKAVEERMMLLNLHYARLEGEQKETLSRRLTFFGVMVALSALASAAAGVISLVPARDQESRFAHLWKLPKSGVDVYVSLSFLLMGALIFGVFYLRSKSRKATNH
jgi:hypothetical protein